MKNYVIKGLKAYFLLFIAFIVFVSCTPPNSDKNRFIDVTGRAAISKAPDQVSISFSVFSNDKDLSIAKNKNDSLILKLRELFEKYNIEQKNISIERINIHPRYRYKNNGYQEFDTYEVIQNISVLLSKIEDYEAFLTELLNMGIDRINNVNFSFSDMRKLMDEARVEAVRAAKEKALLLCNAASEDGKAIIPGRIISITEIPLGIDSRGNSRAKEETYNFKAENLSSDRNFSPMGQIEAAAEVNIVFKLELK